MNTSALSSVFEDLHFEKAEKLIAALTEFTYSSPSWRGKNLIYRGQGDSSWKLVPRLLRPEQRLPNYQSLQEAPVSSRSLKTERDLLRLEIMLIQRLFQNADDIGLAVPNDSLLLRGQLSSLLNDLEYATFDPNDHRELLPWPSASVLSILALMQHHGLPTRLLDWTTSPLAATYFAAKQALTSNVDNGTLAIYVIDTFRVTNWLHKYQSDRRWLSDRFSKETWSTLPNEGKEVIYVVPPTAGNQNAVSQRGRFTFVRRLTNDDIDPREQDYLLSGESNPLSFFKRYLLPHSEASSLLLCLEILGIRASTLFPSWDGVAAAVLDEIYFNRGRDDS